MGVKKKKEEGRWQQFRKKANYIIVYSFDTDTMQVTLHNPLHLSLSLSPMNMSLVSVQSKFISLSPTIMSSVPIKYISFLVPYYYTHNKVKSKKIKTTIKSK